MPFLYLQPAEPAHRVGSSAAAPIEPSVAAIEPLPLQPPIEPLPPIESVTKNRDSSGSNMSWSVGLLVGFTPPPFSYWLVVRKCDADRP